MSQTSGDKKLNTSPRPEILESYAQGRVFHFSIPRVGHLQPLDFDVLIRMVKECNEVDGPLAMNAFATGCRRVHLWSGNESVTGRGRKGNALLSTSQIYIMHTGELIVGVRGHPDGDLEAVQLHPGEGLLMLPLTPHELMAINPTSMVVLSDKHYARDEEYLSEEAWRKAMADRESV
jgi:hypothetical protein